LDATILSSLLVLLQMICVIVVVAYLLTGSRFFPDVPDGHPAVKVFSGEHPQSDDITLVVIRVE